MIRVFVDGQPREIAPGSRIADLAPAGALVARIGEALVDLNRVVDAGLEGAEITFPEPGHPDVVHVLRHSAAHVLAQAVLRLFPDAKYAIGPPITEPPWRISRL